MNALVYGYYLFQSNFCGDIYSPDVEFETSLNFKNLEMKNDLICFSHLRWDFVYQRPQHLMSRFAKEARVFYFEEPVFTAFPDKLHIHIDPANGVHVVTPELEEGQILVSLDQRMKKLTNQLLEIYNISRFVAWYYAPMALAFTNHLQPLCLIYDCMDELSAFNFAPPELVGFEKTLLSKADVVFTGGYRLYEAKKKFHHNIYPFPSAIDKQFFFPARARLDEREDQQNIPHPRLGFYGVIDERFDIELMERMAVLKPDWHFVFIGPVVKIDPASLPRRKNIHYLGMKDYKELPAYISGWDLCIMPFAINASTEFISPTKTPEFLAAGKRVISTPIHDVVIPYGVNGLVGIADNAEAFIEIAEQDLQEKSDSLWLGKVDQFLSSISWDRTWKNMEFKIRQAIEKNFSVTGKKIDQVINNSNKTGKITGNTVNSHVINWKIEKV